jgi:hypothetical protein
MKITKLLLICICCVMAVPAVWGQAAASAAKPGILGYLDPATGAFRPVPPVVDDSAEVPALTTFGGTITVTLTITVKTTGLTTFTCTAATSVLDQLTSAPRSYSETDAVAATGTGTTRTCKLSIPYSWALGTQASDMMSTTYYVLGSATAPTVNQRTSGLSPLDARKVPASGTITALTAAVTL